MSGPVTAVKRTRNQYSVRHDTRSVANVLSRLAGSAWALSCTSFLLTALLIRSNGLPVL